MKKGKINYQQLFSFLLLIITLGVVLYIGFSGNDLNDLLAALRNLTPAYLLACLACWALYVMFDTLSLHHFLRMQGQKIKLRHSLHGTMTGIYYSGITPGATGGQPMEMYRLSKYGVPIGVSGSALAVKFVFFQGVLLATGAVLWILCAPFVQAHTAGRLWFILLGYAANFFTIGMVILMAISKRAVRWLIGMCILAGTKLRICKNPEASRLKWENHCKCFLESVQLMMRHPRDMMIQSLLALGQILSLMMVILAVYHALGLTGTGTWELVAVGVLLYIGASYVPLPGASGAQEGGFASLFQGIFPDAQLFVALLIWRFSTYYMSVLVGATMTILENIHDLRKRRQEGVSNDQAQS